MDSDGLRSTECTCNNYNGDAALVQKPGCCALSVNQGTQTSLPPSCRPKERDKAPCTTSMQSEAAHSALALLACSNERQETHKACRHDTAEGE